MSGSVEIPEVNLADFGLGRAAELSDKAVVEGASGRSVTYGELARLAAESAEADLVGTPHRLRLGRGVDQASRPRVPRGRSAARHR